MAEHAIDVSNLSISYSNRSTFSIKKSFFKFNKSSNTIIHAVNDVSFHVEQGEVFGIIGINGSGKSTLLSSIAGVFSPDRGTIDLHDHSVSLLSLGAAFKKDISGRENIYLYGMLLGIDEETVRSRIGQIIEFSELGDFIDMPVSTYSSGMSSKLFFSTAVFLDTDIILVDEVLSVGDTRFRKKSYKKLREIIKDKKRTAIIVSHQENTLRELCDRMMWMEKGEIRMIGETNAVLDEYLHAIGADK